MLQLGDTCKHGHVIRGDNAQFYMVNGAQRVRCATCNIPPRHKRLEVGDTCKNGHVVEGRNVGIRDGKVHCAECRREAVRRYSKTEKGKQAWARTSSPSERSKRARERAAQRKAAERADQMIQDGKDTNALSYLMLSKRAERANDALWEAYKTKKPKCLNREAEYIDYPEDLPPSINDAYRMCEGCPVLVECGRFANAYKPPIGVWAGQVWTNGRVQQ